MTSSVVILVAALALLIAVLRWSGRYGRRDRNKGTSLRRGPRSHITADGRPKRSFATREAAAAFALAQRRRDNVTMGVYQCDSCGKWHVGH